MINELNNEELELLKRLLTDRLAGIKIAETGITCPYIIKGYDQCYEQANNLLIKVQRHLKNKDSL